METRPLDETDRAMLDLGIPPKPPEPPKPPLPPAPRAADSETAPAIPPKPPLPRGTAPLPPVAEPVAVSRVPHILLAAYIVALTLIAIWPDLHLPTGIRQAWPIIDLSAGFARLAEDQRTLELFRALFEGEEPVLFED